ncbi:MAG: hypothetical protein KME04_20370 [Pleurocapsa minor GSE-CHR-MK-17-07R]|jgi:hypothetical protein|nr:hypothetical protein [Pleurocapsa minor GSE-CHR-MK 17-07R]
MPILERDFDDRPLERDIDESWALGDDETDLGWAYDRRWTTRRILMVLFLVITVVSFLALSFSGLFQPAQGIPLPPTQIMPMV